VDMGVSCGVSLLGLVTQKFVPGGVGLGFGNPGPPELPPLMEVAGTSAHLG